jgi:cytochrome c-type biogenesis protein CcmF
VTVGPPYYNFFLKAFGLPLLLLMGIGPLIAWRRASIRGLWRTFAWPTGVALVTGVALLALGAGSSIPGLVGYTFCAFVLASIALEFGRGTRARHALSGGSWLAAFAELVGRNRRRYGGYLVHASIVLLAIGVVGSSAYDTTRERQLAVGESMRTSDYLLTYRGATRERGPNAIEVRAVVDVRRDGERLGTLRPGKNQYFAEQQVSNEAAIRSDRLTGEDLFLIAEQIRADGVFLKVLVKPLVNLIWLAGFVFVGGALIALWPDAREQRRLAVRYGRGDALVRA